MEQYEIRWANMPEPVGRRAGIQGIALDYVLSRRQDRYGNLLRWVGKVQKNGTPSFRSADVALLTSDLAE